MNCRSYPVGHVPLDAITIVAKISRIEQGRQHKGRFREGEYFRSTRVLACASIWPNSDLAL